MNEPFDSLYDPFSDNSTININDSNSLDNSKISTSQFKKRHKTSRHDRPFSLYSKPNTDGDLNKVIIPYNFEINAFAMQEKSIEFYDKKEYLIDKIREFNSLHSFHIEKRFKASFLQQLGMYFPCCIILVLFLYLSIVVLAFLSFNPVVIYTFFRWGIYMYKTFRSTEVVFLDKFRLSKIKEILDEENIGEFCRQNNLQWLLGQSGYWLELEKII